MMVEACTSHVHGAALHGLEHIIADLDPGNAEEGVNTCGTCSPDCSAHRDPARCPVAGALHALQASVDTRCHSINFAPRQPSAWCAPVGLSALPASAATRQAGNECRQQKHKFCAGSLLGADP